MPFLVPPAADPSAPRWGGTAIALHWSLALALAAVFGLGLYMAELPISPLRLRLYNWHKWAGVVILALSVLRLGWSLRHAGPAAPPMPPWQHRAVQAAHRALYALSFAVPLAGWAYSSAAGFPVVLFGRLPLPDLAPVDEALAELLKPWHRGLALAMAALVLLHAAGALKHQWVDRDGLLARMWPARR